ncbi:phosphatase PAP2 family protein [Candidatus Saccharibacteria bacterium]|nr:phosphatase PAP2 family protein [Candidatus Saccharibacteria bacterium]
MQWDFVTDIILYASFAVLAVFIVLGAIQLFQKKSLKKVDRALTAMFPPLVIMTAIYFIFDKIWILNTRPNGSGEPSFPSSHAMAVATIFGMTALALPKYIKSKPLRITLYTIMLILLILVCIGRVASGMHWATDVACGLVFAFILVILYYLISKPSKKETKHE